MRQGSNKEQVTRIQLDEVCTGAILRGRLEDVWEHIVKYKGIVEVGHGMDKIRIDKKHEFFRSRNAEVYLAGLYKQKVIYRGKPYEALKKFLEISYYPHLYYGTIQKLRVLKTDYVRVQLDYSNNNNTRTFLMQDLSFLLEV